MNQVPFTTDEADAARSDRRMISMRRRLFKWTAIAAGSLAALIVLLLVAFQIAIWRVPEYRIQLQEWLSQKTQLSIEFSELKARFRLYGPELAFADVTVRTPDRTRVLATARGGSIAFDIWNSLRTLRLTAGRFTLDSPQLGLIRTRDGRIQIAGQSALLEETKPFAVENLPIGTFRVRDAVVSFQDEALERGPWSLSGVSFTLDREPELLELAGGASLPAALGQSLEFSAQVVGDLEASQEVVSTVTVDGEALDLVGWADLLPERWPAPQSGHGSVDVTASFVGPRLESIVADAQIGDLVAIAPTWVMPLPTAEPLVIGAKAGPDDRPAADEAVEAGMTQLVEAEETPAPISAAPVLLSYERVDLRARIEREQDGWHAQVTQLDLDAAEAEQNRAVDWHSRFIEAQWALPAAGVWRFAAKADVVLLESIAPLLAYLPESKALAHVRALNLRGTVRDVVVGAERDTVDAPLTYSIAAATDDIGFDPISKIPGATGISGVLKASDAGGEFKLDTGPLHLSIPYMFRWPLDTNAIRGLITWRNDGEAWHIETTDLQFDANDGKGEAKLAIRLPSDGSSPHLEITAQARDMNAAATPKYLPANQLTEDALAWLDRAFVSGRVPRGTLELRGPTREFPFRNGNGLFLVRGFVEDLTFDYQAGWTPAAHLTGNVEFRNEGMHASGITARVGDLEVTEASGGFADFKAGDLKIAASASGDLGAALGFLQSSPIGEALGETFADLRGNGTLESNVSLLLPITHVEDRRLSVATKLQNATVRLVNLDAPLTQLSGSLIVRQDLPVEADLKGQWLGGAVDVSITPDDQADESASLVASGRTSADKLAPFLPSLVKLSGSTDWRLTTRLTSRKQARQTFAIDSSMRGLSVGLPYPVGKPAESVRPLHVDLEPGSRQLLARASFGPLRALLRFAQTNAGWGFDRGGVRADNVLAALPDHLGLRVEGSIDRVRLDDWFALADADDAAAASIKPQTIEKRKLSDVLRAANVRVGLLQLYGYEWPDVRGVMQATDRGWRVDVTGSNIEGQLIVPESFAGTDPLSIDLERLIVMRTDESERKEDTEAQTQRDPREWPSMNVHIGDMHVENHPIGGVELNATRIPNGLRIDSLVVAQDAVQAEASGEWLMGPQGERSSLVAKITSTDVRATLRALNYTEFLEAERAEVSARLHWAGGFDGNLVKHASGSITVSAESGQLLTLQPGAGRVLGLFSVAALPRRLSLDFSDLTEKGLSFDTIRGDFELREGNAYTENLTLRGPAAEIGIAGRTGLGSQDFDQTAVVTGNLGASIPVAGALAGGPAVGAALLLFSQVFKEPLKGIARGYYRITGTWDEPVVERVDASEAKAREAN